VKIFAQNHGSYCYNNSMRKKSYTVLKRREFQGEVNYVVVKNGLAWDVFIYSILCLPIWPLIFIPRHGIVCLFIYMTFLITAIWEKLGGGRLLGNVPEGVFLIHNLSFLGMCFFMIFFLNYAHKLRINQMVRKNYKICKEAVIASNRNEALQQVWGTGKKKRKKTFFPSKRKQ